MTVGSKKKVLLIGFQPFNENMYPHLYEFITILEEECDLTYFDEDDRGVERWRLGCHMAPSLHPYRMLRFVKRALEEYRRHTGVREKIRLLLEGDFDTVIVIDHSALNVAAEYIKDGVKLVLWSHDIITYDHNWRDSYWIRRMLHKNVESAKRCNLVLIQDYRRGVVLASVLKNHKIPECYLPVSMKSDDLSVKVALKRAERGGGAATTELMQLGAIHLKRSSGDLIDWYQSAGEGIELVFKGNIEKEIVNKVEGSKRKASLRFRTPSLKEMRDDLMSVDIGFITIDGNINNFFYSMASGQLVEFARFGIPVIVLCTPDLAEFVTREGCGVVIEGLDELDGAIERINSEYGTFSRASRSTYDRYFNIDEYRSEIVERVI